MRGKGALRTVALVALLIATPILAGCTDSAAGATAMAQRSSADDEANDWSSQAELVGILGFEGTSDFPDESSDDQAPADDLCEGDWIQDAEEDSSVGNGEAAFWIYIYQAADKDQDHIVVLDGDGGTVAECDVPPESDMQPLGSFSVDSDEAAETAASENSAIEEASGVILMLMNSGDMENPTWIVMAASQGAGGIVTIDATTGDVTFNSEDFGGMGSGS